MDFAEELKFIRLRNLEWTQEKMGELLGAHWKTIRNWEKGDTVPPGAEFIIMGLKLWLRKDKRIASYDDLIILARAVTTGKKYMSRILEVNGEMDCMNEALDIVKEKLT